MSEELFEPDVVEDALVVVALAAIADSRACEFRDPLAWAHWCRTIAVESQAGDAAEVERLIRERR